MKKAVIFDMDGVVSDTQKFHAAVESKILKRFGIILSPQVITERYAGFTNEQFYTEIFALHKKELPDMEGLITKKWQMMKELSAGKLTAIPHAIALIKTLKENGFKLAIASSSTQEFIRYVVNALAIENYFDTLVSAEEVAHGKPAPDIFLLAAKQLGVKPEEAIVIEDGRSGMIGARKAGMKCIGLVKNVESDYPADILITSLANVTIKKIQASFTMK